MPSKNFTITVVSIVAVILLLIVFIFSFSGDDAMSASQPTYDPKSPEEQRRDNTILNNDTNLPSDTDTSTNEKKSIKETSERPNGDEYKDAKRIDNLSTNRILIDDDAVFRRIHIMGEYISVFCGRKIMDALKGSISTKTLKDFITERGQTAPEEIKDYPFYIYPQLIITSETIERALDAKENNGDGRVKVKIPFSTYHPIIIDEIQTEIRKDIPNAVVQVMPYDKVVLMYKTESEKEVCYTSEIDGNFTDFEVTFIAPEKVITEVLNKGRIFAKYRIPAIYYARNLSAASVEVLGEIYNHIEDKLETKNQSKQTYNDIYGAVGIQAIIKGVPFKFGIANNSTKEDKKIDRWMMKEHLQSICENISINAAEYGYTEFDGATEEEKKLPDLSQYLDLCFPDKKIVKISLDRETGILSYKPDDANLNDVISEQLKNDNGLRDKIIDGSNPLKVQVNVDNIDKIAKVVANLSYTFHHITNQAMNTAVNIRKTRMNYETLSCQRIVGPVIVSSIKPHETRDVPVPFDSVAVIKGAKQIEGGTKEMAQTREDYVNKFLLTTNDKCLNQGATIFRIDGNAKIENEEAIMNINCTIKDNDTNYIWSKKIKQNISNVIPEGGKLLGIVTGSNNGDDKDVHFEVERKEYGYNQHHKKDGYNHGEHTYNNMPKTERFSLLEINNLNKFFSKADVMGEYHNYWRTKKDNVKYFGWFRKIFGWYWDYSDEDKTNENIELDIKPQLNLRIETKPQRFVFSRPRSDFKIEFIYKDGKFVLPK
jgi:hypothetical protein